MYSVTGAILLVAAFGIYNIISTVVFEKTRDIAILKSLGFTEGDISACSWCRASSQGCSAPFSAACSAQLMIEGLAQVRFRHGRNTGGQRPLPPGAGLADLRRRLLLRGGLGGARRSHPGTPRGRLDPVQIVRGAA
jgi:lipoprotein-releasing system permease protein